MNIIEWAEKTAGYPLYPAQRFTLKVLYGLPLSVSEQTISFECPVTGGRRSFTEQEYLHFLVDEGRARVGEVHGHNVAVLVVGRRAGKTSLMATCTLNAVRELVSYENPQARYGLREDALIHVLGISMCKDAAAVNRGEVKRLLDQDESLHSFGQEGLSNLGFSSRAAVRRDPRRPADILVQFKSGSAKGLRGRNTYFIGFDEMAFFTQDQDDSFLSATPGTIAFSPKEPGSGYLPVGPVESRTFAFSSPNGCQGKFYELYKTAPTMLQIPSWEMNPTIPRAYFKQRIKESGHANFWVEHGAEFADWRGV